MTDLLPLDGVNDPWRWASSMSGWVSPAYEVTFTEGASVLVSGPVPVGCGELDLFCYTGTTLADRNDLSGWVLAADGSPTPQTNTAIIGSSSVYAAATDGIAIAFFLQYEADFGGPTAVPDGSLNVADYLGDGFTIGDPYVWPEDNAPTFLRHAPRHVHHTVANAIQAAMAALNWTTPGATPLGAPVLRFQKEAPLPGGRLDQKIQAGLVSITLGDESATDPQELGGPLTSQEYPIFIDVFMGSDGEATAVASDVRDILLGRFPDTHRFLNLVNQATGTPVENWLIELDDVERIRPNRDFQLYWQVVKVTATAYFFEMAY